MTVATFTVSAEQEAACRRIVDGYNVTIRAVAGSGKTTTLQRLSQLKTNGLVIIMYNRKLADETKVKIKRAKVTTLHSYCQEVYGIDCSTDIGLQQIIDQDMACTVNSLDDEFADLYVQPSTNFSTLVVDEAQDLTPLMVQIVNKLFRDNNQPANLVLLGDQNQAIYPYQGSSSKFLLEPHLYFDGVDPYLWFHTSLSTSWRCPAYMCDFVSTVFSIDVRPSSRPSTLSSGLSSGLSEERPEERPTLEALSPASKTCGHHHHHHHHSSSSDCDDDDDADTDTDDDTNSDSGHDCNIEGACNHGSSYTTNSGVQEYNDDDDLYEEIDDRRLNYVICEPPYQVVDYILKYMKRYNIKPSEACLICPYLRNNYKLVQISNMLSRQGGIPLFISVLHSEAHDERLANGKFIISSIHSMKGRERKCVFIYGFDASYNRIFDKGLTDSDEEETKALFYVALTRTKHHCVVFQDRQEMPLQFLPKLNSAKLRRLISVQRLTNVVEEELRPLSMPVRQVSDHDIGKALSRLNSATMLKLWQLLRITEVQPAGRKLSIATIAEVANNRRSVSGNNVADADADVDADTNTTACYYEDTLAVVSLLLPVCLCIKWQDKGVTGDKHLKDLMYNRYGGKGKDNDLQSPRPSEVEVGPFHALAKRCQLAVCRRHGYLAPLQQVTDFSWLKDEHVLEAAERMMAVVTPTDLWCQTVRHDKLHGNVDLTYPDSVWSLKVQEDLSVYDFLGAAALLACACFNTDNNKSCVVNNVNDVDNVNNVDNVNGQTRDRPLSGTNQTQQVPSAAYIYNIYSDQLVKVYFDTSNDCYNYISTLNMHVINSYNRAS